MNIIINTLLQGVEIPALIPDSTPHDRSDIAWNLGLLQKFLTAMLPDQCEIDGTFNEVGYSNLFAQ